MSPKPSPGEIVQALRRATAGEPVLSPTVTRQLIDHVAGPAGHQRSRAQTMFETLSECEREIARAIGHGQSNTEIAETLFMSVSTVKAHITRILAKLDLTNRTQVALLVHDGGLI